MSRIMTNIIVVSLKPNFLLQISSPFYYENTFKNCMYDFE